MALEMLLYSPFDTATAMNVQKNLDRLLNQGYEIKGMVSGRRSDEAKDIPADEKDYVFIIVHKPTS